MTTEPIAAGTPEAPQNPTAEVPDLTKSWFFGPDDGIPLPLPGGHSITILPELPTGIYTDTWVLDDNDPHGSMERFKIKQLAGHLEFWSLGDVPADFAKRVELVGTLGTSHLDRITKVLEEYLEAHPMPLNIPIIPVQPLSPFASFFVAGDESITLDLPGGNFVRIKAELKAIDHQRLIASGEGKYAGLRKLATYIVQWSLKYPNDRIAPVGIDSLREMRTSRFNVLLRTIEAYERELAARDANPIGIGGSIKPSESVN